jgi:uncharacterized protein YcaQ
VARRRRDGLSAAEARALAVDAQGLHAARSARPPTTSGVGRVAERLGALQLDAINVVERTQFLVLFSRLGSYDRAKLHELTAPRTGTLWEYWGHAASLLPVATHPLFRWRMVHGSTYVAGPKVEARRQAWYAAHKTYIDAVLVEVRERGPLAASQLRDPRRRTGEWWDRRSVGREALEWLFGTGELCAWRTAGFERVYDLPERVIPTHILEQPTPPTDEAQRRLVEMAARAQGVATAADLANYFMLQPRVAKQRVGELVDAGVLAPVDVEGWDEVAYRPTTPPRSTRTREPSAPAGRLLSPFDSLIWNRARNRRLFGFDFTIEVYVPAPKRIYGYYVLPILLEDQLVGRVDLKADRAKSVLRVNGAFVEPGHAGRARDIADATASELHELRRWLDLDDLTVGRRGNLAATLLPATKGSGA